MTERKRKAKAGTTRTEVFAMRLDPKLKYLAEIAARKQRRSLANFIEWSVEQSLGKVLLVEIEPFGGPQDRTVLDEASKLWDLEPSDRFIKLAENYPDLLTYEEQLIWKAIHEITAMDSYKDEAGKTQYVTYDFVNGEGKNKKPDNFTIRELWTTLVAYSEGHVTEKDVREELKKSMPF